MNVLSQSRPAGTAASPDVTGFYHEKTGSIAYLVVDPATLRAAIIDPVLDFDPRAGRVTTTSADAMLASVTARGLTVEWILDTHPHADHLSAAAYMKDKLGAPMAIGEKVADIQSLWETDLQSAALHDTMVGPAVQGRRHVQDRIARRARHAVCRPHARFRHLCCRRCRLHSRHDVPAGFRYGACGFSRWQRGCAVRFDPAHSGIAGRDPAVHRA